MTPSTSSATFQVHIQHLNVHKNLDPYLLERQGDADLTKVHRYLAEALSPLSGPSMVHLVRTSRRRAFLDYEDGPFHGVLVTSRDGTIVRRFERPELGLPASALSSEELDRVALEVVKLGAA